MTEDKKRTEYQAGKINFEENLRRSLEKAHREYSQGNFLGMCLELQSVWRQAWEKDRKKIIELVEKRANQDYRNMETRDHSEGSFIDKQTFLGLITSQRDVVDGPNYEPDLYEKEWVDILSTMNEALLREYLGKQRWTEVRHEE